jgi:hypothetical protein
MTTGIFNVMVRHNSEQLQSNMQITSAVLSAANTSTAGGQCLYQPALCVCVSWLMPQKWTEQKCEQLCPGVPKTHHKCASGCEGRLQNAQKIPVIPAKAAATLPRTGTALAHRHKTAHTM